MKLISRLAAGAAIVLATTPADAFGLRTHLYIADQVLADLADCKLSAGSEIAIVPQDLCDTLKDNRAYFMAGALGPDVFPDLVIGQTYVHPGTPQGRQAADWFDLLMREAKTGPEIAFAFGEMIHASGDVFAHSYVNNYAGDIFEIGARWHKDVEQRHFDLEKYIDQRLPYEPNLNDLAVPSDLLVRTMVQTSYVPANVKITHKEILDAIRNPAEKASSVLAEKLARAGPAAHMTGMWAILLVAERAPINSTCNEIEAVNRLTGAFEKYVEAESLARGVTQSGRAEPQESLEGICTNVHGVDVGPRLAQAEERLEQANARFRRAVENGRLVDWTDTALNEREAWWRALKGKERSRLKNAYKDYSRAAQTRERMRAIRGIAPKWAEDVRTAVKAYMEHSLAAGKLMILSSQPVPPAAHEKRSMTFPYESWRACYLPVFRGQPATAAAETCKRIGELKADLDLSDVTLWGGIGETPRSLAFGYIELTQWLDELGFELLLKAAKLVSPSLGGLIDSVHKPVRVTRTKLNKTFASARNGQLGFKCVSDFIDADLGMVARAEGVREDVPCAARPEKAYDFFKPEEFVPIRHAITLGKLAILNEQGIKQLANDIARRQVTVDTGNHERYSIILDTVKSLDSSYQWQGLSMPMPRARPQAAKRPSTGGGYPVLKARVEYDLPLDSTIEKRPGFPYYRTSALRRDVFSKLFPEPFEGEILKRREYGPDYYPFTPCSHDPFRRTHGGAGHVPVCHTGSPD